MTPKESKTANRVGIFAGSDEKKVIIKQTTFHVEDLDALYLRNEAAVLESLSQIDGSHIFPKFIAYKKMDHSTYLVTSFVKGELLHKANKTIRRDVVIRVYNRLAQLSSELKKNNYGSISHRNPISYVLSLPVICMRAIINSPRDVLFFLKLSALFYTHYLLESLKGFSKGLAHRDLYPDNILYSLNNGDITLLDWESAVVTDPLYDLAQIAMIYYEDFGIDALVSFLQEHLGNNGERKRFYALSIYNGMQILSQNDAKSEVFIHTAHFLHIILPQIYHTLYYRKSPFELINGITLSAIFLFYKITGLPFADSGKKILLCYHSIGNDGWRFSTRTERFKSHIEVLSEYYSFVTLPDLLSKNRGGLNINFDDGYANVYSTAFPILANKKIPATIFAIGNTEIANRGELENNVPFMTIPELQKLQVAGWEIGFHTATHGPIASMNNDQLKAEITDGKKMLEKKLGTSVRYFAYPKGYYNDAVLKHVRDAGLSAAFTVNGRELVQGPAVDPMLYDRVPVDGEMSSTQLLALISPIGLRISALFLRILQIKESLSRQN